LNVSGAGEGNAFTWAFTDDDPYPSRNPHPGPLPVRRERGICCGDNGFRHEFAGVRMI
jgi:hypothetical protein